MGEKRQYYINLSAPNLVNICIDKRADGEPAGRLFHCYDREPRQFKGFLQLLNLMETLYDTISFPQASAKTRYFDEPEGIGQQPPEKQEEQKDIIRHRGEIATFITYVQYRQNSTWQGETTWMEKERQYRFSSTLEFIRLVDHAEE